MTSLSRWGISGAGGGRIGARLLCCIFLALMLLLVWVASLWYRDRLLVEERARQAVKLSLYGNSLSIVIDRSFARLDGLHAFAMTARSARDLAAGFEMFAAGLHSGAKGVRNFALAPAAVVSYVYPLRGNEKALGHDLMRDPATRPEVERALRERSIVLTPPYQLRQGGMGLVGRKAVYRNGAFWGLAAMVIDLNSLFELAGLDVTDGTLLALRDASGKMLLGDQRIFSMHPVIQRIVLPDGFWELAGLPRQGWNSAIWLPLFLFRATGLALALLLSMLLFLLLNRQQELAGAVEERTAQLARRNEELRQERDFSGTLLDSLPGVVYLYDRDMRFRRWNRRFEEVLGYRGDEIAAMQPLQFFGEGSRELVRSRIEEVFEKGSSSVEADFISRDGSATPYFFTGLRIEINGESCLLGVGIDISQRKKLEDELVVLNRELEGRVAERTRELEESRHALIGMVKDLEKTGEALHAANEKLLAMDRVKSMFIASMSHELRTPLNSVIGFTSVLLDEWVGPLNQEQKENLQIVLRAGRHLLSLINDVIDFSRIEAGMIELRETEFDLHELVSEAAGSMLKEASDKRLLLRVENLHLVMHTDRARLLQCLLNLLSNAVKYTESGEVAVSVRLFAPGEGKSVDEAGSAASVEITVSDTGIGIPEEDQQRLFQPFVRFDSHLRSTVTGTGLGLYLTRKIVQELLMGKITFSSSAGAGSSFTLSVPIKSPPRNQL